MKFVIIIIVSISFLTASLQAFSAEDGEGFSENEYQIKLSWAPVSGVSRYKIQVSSKKNFKPILAQDEIEKPEWIWKFHLKALHGSKKEAYYRVASVNELGEVGEFSKIQTVPLPRKVEFRAEHKKIEPTRPRENINLPEMKQNPSIHEPIVTYLSTSWRWSLLASAGVDGLNQSSNDSNLKGVSGSPNFVQERIRLSLDLLNEYRLDGKEDVNSVLHSRERGWSAQIQFGYDAFRAIQTPRVFNQPNVWAYNLRADVLKWVNGASLWQWGYGLSLNRSYRWLKTGSESVDDQGAFSVGPALSLEMFAIYEAGFKVSDLGLFFALPATGAFTSGQWGPDLELWGEWNFWRVGRTDTISVRLEADGSYFFWNTPASTSVLFYSGKLGIGYHWNP